MHGEEQSEDADENSSECPNRKRGKAAPAIEMCNFADNLSAISLIR